ncbi:hypothetical protein JL720_11889 [Aureococcus anophagefferens]|nr:hypothetical protein JL720_11889 [Aureococcus anophagefferens]
MATNVEKKDDGAKKSSGLRSTRKLFARWTGLRHAVKRTTKALVGPREPAREPPRILIDSTYAKRTFKKAELEKLFEKRKNGSDLARRPRTSKGRAGRVVITVPVLQPKATIQRMVEIVIDELGAEECPSASLRARALARATTGLGCAFASNRAANAAGEALKRTRGVVAWSDRDPVTEATFEVTAAWTAEPKTIALTPEDRKLLGEPLFNPKKVDKQAKTKGLAALIKQSIYKSEEDMAALGRPPRRRRLEPQRHAGAPRGGPLHHLAGHHRRRRDGVAGAGRHGGRAAYLTTLPEFENNWIRRGPRGPGSSAARRDTEYNC